MVKNSTRSPLLYSKTISKRKIEDLNRQLVKVPSIWKQRFKKDMWQLVITDKMPQEYGGAFAQYYVDGSEKQIWINVSIPTITNNVIFKAFGCYVYLEYANERYSETFSNICKEKEKDIRLFTTIRGMLVYDEFRLFVEMFSFVIETDGNNIVKNLSSIYLYIKRWVTGDVFNLNYSQIPNYIEIGKGVIDEQLEGVKKSFLILPARLKQDFVERNWKIRLSNEKIIGNTTCGLCSNCDRKIYIKSSAPDVRLTTWHEFGHYLDYRERLISESFAFTGYFFMEKENLKEFYKEKSDYDYAISCCEEYFAELFANYINDKNRLCKFVPKSVQMMEKIINNWY